MDYFLARYYSSAQGRFTSPDEFTGGPDELFEFASSTASNPTFYADLTEPQSLNKYQYCYGNPLALVDPDGHQSIRERLNNMYQEVKQAVKDPVGTAKGIASAWAEDNGLDLIVPGVAGKGNSQGRAIGHVAATTQGLVEINLGVNTIGGSIGAAPLLVVGGGPVGVAVDVSGVLLGAGEIVHGGAVILNARKNIENERSASGKQEPTKDRSTAQGRQEQLEGIEQAQKDYRSGKRKKPVDSTKRSKQEFKKGLKEIQNLKDAEEQYKP